MMKMSYYILLAYFLVFFAAVPCATAEPLRVSSEKWQDYTNSDGTGLYIDMLEMVYKPHGYMLEVSIVPYTRSIYNTMNGKSDLWVGAYDGEEKGAIYPKAYLDIDVVEAVCRKGILSDDDLLPNLSGKSLGWIRGYGYDEYFPYEVRYREYDDRLSAMKSLQKKKLDCFLEDEIINAVLEREYADYVGELDRRVILTLPIYLAFGPTEKGRILASIFDRDFPKYLKSGQIKELHKKWKLPYYEKEMLQLLN